MYSDNEKINTDEKEKKDKVELVNLSCVDLGNGQLGNLLPGGANQILDWSADWLDQGTRIYFSLGAVNYIIDMVKTTILNNPAYVSFNNSFGWIWNFYDALAGYANAIRNSGKYDVATYRKSEKMAWAHLDNVMSTQLIGTTTLTIVATQGLLHGTIPLTKILFTTACLPLAAFGFAACMWASFAKACVKLDRSRKILDPEYYLEDRIERYNNIISKLTNVPEGCQLKEEMKKKLLAKKERFRKEILAYAKVYYHLIEKNTKIMNFLKSAEFIENNDNNRILNDGNNLIAPTKIEKIMVKHLKDEQKIRVLKDSVSVGAWGLAAVGMTLIAFGAFFPPLMLPGMIIAAIAGAVKLGEVLVPVISNAIAANNYENSIIDEYRTSIENNHINADSPVTYNDEQIKWYMAYDLCKAYPAKFSNSGEGVPTQEQFFDALRKMKKESPFGAWIYLRNAQREYLETRMLANALGFSDKNFDENLIKDINNLHLSDKDKRYIRQNYVLSSQSGIGFFSHKQTAEADITSNKFDSDPDSLLSF